MTDCILTQKNVNSIIIIHFIRKVSNNIHTFCGMTITVEGRRSEILDVLRSERYLKVADLSQRLGVSHMSIRRDLCQLEEQGILRRVYGNIVATPLLRLGIEINPEVVSQLLNQSDTNEAMAQPAVALVQPGDHLIFDSGILSYLTACALPGDLLTQGDLTVITNSLLVALELAPWPGIEMIMLGGEF
jgi:DeoR/GlpR family transcriptional regulator of sugar metabolism